MSHEGAAIVRHFRHSATYLNVARTTVLHLFCRMTSLKYDFLVNFLTSINTLTNGDSLVVSGAVKFSLTITITKIQN